MKLILGTNWDAHTSVYFTSHKCGLVPAWVSSIRKARGKPRLRKRYLGKKALIVSVNKISSQAEQFAGRTARINPNQRLRQLPSHFVRPPASNGAPPAARDLRWIAAPATNKRPMAPAFYQGGPILHRRPYGPAGCLYTVFNFINIYWQHTQSHEIPAKSN